MKLFGLIGHPLSHSFSERYFTEKFKKENISNAEYKSFDIADLNEFPSIIKQHPHLLGLNVTIPYKETICNYLDDIDPVAKEIGAVNTIKIDPTTRKLTGFNTDYYGFKQSLKPFIESHHQRALILGTGGASKAVYHVLNELNIDCLFVSRNPSNKNEMTYTDVNEQVIKHHPIIVNTTPIGMFPDVNAQPEIPYQYLTSSHLLYDLVYNPKETLFLKEGKLKGATTLNGYQMLTMQAEKSWEIWNNNTDI